jgi:serine/threonine-protein kinase RsbW
MSVSTFRQSFDTREVLVLPLFTLQSLTRTPRLARAVHCLKVTGLKFQSEFRDMACAQAVSLTSPGFRSAPFVELRQSLPSQIAIISPFVDQLMHFIARFRTPDGSELNIETALREALANAIMHGNHEDPRKLVCVACRCTTDGEISLTVQDEGQGFDTTTVPDPTTPENRLLLHGRGIYLMRTLMDEVCFELGGAVVYMHKGSNARPWTARKSA